MVTQAIADLMIAIAIGIVLWTINMVRHGEPQWMTEMKAAYAYVPRHAMPTRDTSGATVEFAAWLKRQNRERKEEQDEEARTRAQDAPVAQPGRSPLYAQLARNAAELPGKAVRGAAAEVRRQWERTQPERATTVRFGSGSRGAVAHKPVGLHGALVGVGNVLPGFDGAYVTIGATDYYPCLAGAPGADDRLSARALILDRLQRRGLLAHR